MRNETNAAEEDESVRVDVDAQPNEPPSRPRTTVDSFARDLPAGTVVDGKYRIDALLGHGGMGVVVAATHLQLRERVALKFLTLEGEDGGAVRSRFRREAQIAAKVRNEHITRVIDVGSFRGTEYIVMEHLDGVSLRQRVKSEGRMSPEKAVRYIVQLCEGLAEVHGRGIVHRDLKPSNVFVIQRADGSELLKILDFGISKWSSSEETDDDLTKTGAVLGSPRYMAPEQLFGSNRVDQRADVWSLGAMLYEMLAGRCPYDTPGFAQLCADLASGRSPPDVSTLRPEISPELGAAVMLCLQLDLERRLPNVAVLAGELLASTHDPLADTVQRRLVNALDPAQTPPEGMRSGTYVAAMLARTESITPRDRDGFLRASGSVATLAATPEAGRRSYLWLGVVAFLGVLGLVAFLGSRPQATPPAAAAPASTPAPIASAPEPTGTPSPVTPATTVAPVVTAAVATTTTTTAKTGASPKHGVGAKPAPTVTAKETAATAPPPPPPPAVTETKKEDPLGDRQ